MRAQQRDEKGCGAMTKATGIFRLTLKYSFVQSLCISMCEKQGRNMDDDGKSRERKQEKKECSRGGNNSRSKRKTRGEIESG